MRINIGAHDYFEQLILMDKYYGQEEDLYPWIYMLLQMAECNKKENKIYNIRDVHQLKRLPNEKFKELLLYKLKEFLVSPQKRVPEYIILDKQTDTAVCLGCVEIKENSNSNEKAPFDLQYVSLGLKYVKGGLVPIKSLKCCDTYQIKELLQKCKKVLFTNGLEFYYLKLTSNDMVEIKEIANLKDEYDNYKNASSDKEKKIITDALKKGDFKTLEIEANDGEWTKLIKGLANINWYEDPKTVIC